MSVRGKGGGGESEEGWEGDAGLSGKLLSAVTVLYRNTRKFSMSEKKIVGPPNDEVKKITQNFL